MDLFRLQLVAILYVQLFTYCKSTVMHTASVLVDGASSSDLVVSPTPGLDVIYSGSSLLLPENVSYSFLIPESKSSGGSVKSSYFLPSPSTLPDENITTINPVDPTCSRNVDKVAVDLSGTISNDKFILTTWCTNVTDSANIYCTTNQIACGLQPNFIANYSINNCIACLSNGSTIATSKKRQITGFSIRYYLTQPDNSGSAVPIDAMVTITNEAIIAFQAATGIEVIRVYTIPANIDNYDEYFVIRVLMIVIGAVVGSVVLVTVLLAMCICINKFMLRKKKKWMSILPTISTTPLTEETDYSTF